MFPRIVMTTLSSVTLGGSRGCDLGYMHAARSRAALADVSRAAEVMQNLYHRVIEATRRDALPR